MPSPEDKMDDLIEFLATAAGPSATVRQVGAHGVEVVGNDLNGDVLAVEDRGPNGATVVDVRHSYDGYGQANAVVRVGWV